MRQECNIKTQPDGEENCTVDEKTQIITSHSTRSNKSLQEMHHGTFLWYRKLYHERFQPKLFKFTKKTE